MQCGVRMAATGRLGEVGISVPIFCWCASGEREGASVCTADSPPLHPRTHLITHPSTSKHAHSRLTVASDFLTRSRGKSDRCACNPKDCSAVTGMHLLEGMNWIVDDIASRIYLMD